MAGGLRAKSFDGAEEPAAQAFAGSINEDYPDVEEWTPRQLLDYEKECLGFILDF